MTLTAKIAWDDTVLPFQLDRSDIRGRVARLDTTLDQILAQHDYPKVVEAMVAEMALLTALIGQTIKLRWKLSLQVRSDGPIRLIATDFLAPDTPGDPARIRAYASYDAERLDHDAEPFPQIGKGYFAILIDQGADMTPYQGITPIAGGSLSACAEAYFAQSEQLPTRFTLKYGEAQEPGQSPGWRAGGVMLQLMPEASLQAKDGASGDQGLLTADDLVDGDEGENWTRANTRRPSVETSRRKVVTSNAVPSITSVTVPWSMPVGTAFIPAAFASATTVSGRAAVQRSRSVTGTPISPFRTAPPTSHAP